MNWHSIFFLLFSIGACGFALAVVLSSNIVRMAFYLVLSLGATAGLFFLAGSNFIGAMQLLIYVGGTLVLLIFGVMLTAQTPFVSMKTRGGDWVLAGIVGGSLLALLVQTAFSVPEWQPMARASNKAADDNKSKSGAIAKSTDAGVVAGSGQSVTEVGEALLGARVDTLAAPEAQRGGVAGYLLPFEIVSVHLLVVLIGAAYLARAKRRTGPAVAVE